MNNIILSKCISVIGLGKLGLPYLAAAASCGFKTIGVDTDKNLIQKINSGKLIFSEPQLSELLHKHQSRISLTTNVENAVRNSQLTFVIVPTPSNKSGEFSNYYLEQVLKNIGSSIKGKKDYHVIAIVSTIMPLSIDQKLLPFLEKISGKKVGENIGLCYNPSFIALGNVINNLRYPDMVLIGESDKQAGNVVAHFHQKLTLNDPPIRKMNFVNAEISKIALNTYITTKISYANMLAQVCEQTPGADANQVTQAIGTDSRVGHKYLIGAVAYGGPCFPRDNRAFWAFGKKRGVKLQLAQATDTVNQQQTESIAKRILPKLDKNATIGILGLSYKEKTSVTDESQGIKLADYFFKKGKKILIYDPILSKQNSFKLKYPMAKTLTQIVNQSQALIITNPSTEFSNTLPRLLTKIAKPAIIIYDLWHILNPGKLPPGIDYIVRGKYY